MVLFGIRDYAYMQHLVRSALLVPVGIGISRDRGGCGIGLSTLQAAGCVPDISGALYVRTRVWWLEGGDHSIPLLRLKHRDL